MARKKSAPGPEAAPRMIPLSALAKRWGFSRRKVYKMVEDKQLPVVPNLEPMRVLLEYVEKVEAAARRAAKVA